MRHALTQDQTPYAPLTLSTSVLDICSLGRLPVVAFVQPIQQESELIQASLNVLKKQFLCARWKNFTVFPSFQIPLDARVHQTQLK
jgi:hypothetical protein